MIYATNYRAASLRGQLVHQSDAIRIIRFDLGSATVINWTERKADPGHNIFLYVMQRANGGRIECAALHQEDSARETIQPFAFRADKSVKATAKPSKADQGTLHALLEVLDDFNS